MDSPAWNVEFTPSARREFRELRDSVKRSALNCIEEVAEDPVLEGSLLLRGHTDLYRIKFYRQRYRIVYRVSEKQRKILIERIRSRASAYAGL